MGKDKEETIKAIKSSLIKSHPKWDDDKLISTAHKIYNARGKASSKKEFSFKEDEEFRVFGFIRTDLPDLEHDVTPKSTLNHWADQINGGFPEANKGDMHHDRFDPHLVSVAEYAEVLPLPDKPGHHGLWVSDFVNVKHPEFETIKYEIENNMLPAYSVEFSEGRVEEIDGNNYILDSDLWGYAHANRPIDTSALKTSIKERTDKIYSYGRFNLTNRNKEVKIMTEKEKELPPEVVTKDVEKKEVTEPKIEEKVEVKEIVKETPEVKVDIKEDLELFRKEMKESISKIQPEIKPLMKNKEIEEKEMDSELPLKFKEMKEAVDKKDWMAFKEAGIDYLDENSADVSVHMKEGIPLNCTMKMRCKGNKIEIVGAPKMKFKDILQNDSNAGAYTESAVEFADIFQPGIINTFNEQEGLFGEVLKVDNIGGAPMYGFTLQLNRNEAGGAVSPNDVSVETGFIDKLKCRQEIKVYRFGVSVADYTLFHSRASLGQLFQLEVDKAMEAWVHAVATALYAEDVGTEATGTAILGLEAVADSAGNTTLYGKTRSTANRLSPTAAGDTYTVIGAAITEQIMRIGIDQLQTEGTEFNNVRFVVNPTMRSKLFNVLDTNIRFSSVQRTAAAELGFDRGPRPSYDGVPIIIDHRCNSATTTGDEVYCIDVGPNGYVMVVSKPPQLTGLAKVSAAQSAYVEGYLTTVYKRPRNVWLAVDVR